MKFVWALFLAGLVYAADPLPPINVSDTAALIGGPMVVNATSNSATVVWLVKNGVELARTTDRDALRSMVKVVTHEYKDLRPGREYAFEFGGSVKARFRTPTLAPKDFSFIAYGDTRTRHDVHQRVVDRMLRYDPAFVIHTGDLVADGTQTEQWRTFLGVEKELLSSTVLFPSPGNHERQSPQYFDFLAARSHYSFDWGAVHFSVLNSDVGNVPKDRRAAFWDEQKKWLDDDLAAASNARFRIVTFHHPPFSAVAGREINEASRELVPILEKHRVRLVINGHDHNYQRHFKNGVTYIVTGGGGAPLYAADGPLPGITQKTVKLEHLIKVDVRGGKLDVKAIGIEGQEIDGFQLKQ